MKIVNLTPHAICVRLSNGQEVTFAPSGKVCRVTTTEVYAGEVTSDGNDIPVVHNRPGKVEGLPPYEEGTKYLTSTLVAQAAALEERWDVLAPNTGPSAIRNEKGQIVAVTSFQAF